MLGGVNDRVEQARTLAELLDPKVFKVNLIPYNPTGIYDGSTRKAIAAFKSVLGGARTSGDRASDTRSRHRGRLRSARSGAAYACDTV